MKGTQTPEHPAYQSVKDAVDAALAIMVEKRFGDVDHYGASMVLCGLLTVAFILEGKNESEHG